MRTQNSRELGDESCVFKDFNFSLIPEGEYRDKIRKKIKVDETL